LFASPGDKKSMAWDWVPCCTFFDTRCPTKRSVPGLVLLKSRSRMVIRDMSKNGYFLLKSMKYVVLCANILPPVEN
jgi:hypothetical protein